VVQQIDCALKGMKKKVVSIFASNKYLSIIDGSTETHNNSYIEILINEKKIILKILYNK
jgi:hypothetical protein